ncbi:hypothetical protein [Eikenella corrodens]|uniref:hypothetical protein n=1 Tax=Eikenella corrodens TaxID=539 RepID=UPI000B4C5658|nr:hypothetical protein [Eikenella corrodens]OWP27189.1 hypothetical protein CA838_02525 [Eikenella corrodens]
MKTPLAAWTAAFFLGAAFIALPTMDAQDPYLQAEAATPLNPAPPQPAAAELIAAKDQQAEQEASQAERRYREMDDVQIMRGVVYEPEGDK